MSDFEVVIGLEVHVQLATESKLFAGVSHRFGQAPNSQVDPVAMGLPGSLPVLNERAVELATTAAVALGCDVHERSVFDRKHYFYPDSPRNYQISQYDQPYCTGGGVTIETTDGEKFLPLTRIHMEDDAGKLVHQDGGAYSEVDLNRAGTPLIEIVSEPNMRSPADAYAFLVALKRSLKYAGVSDCEMQEGSLRCDANVSVRPSGTTELGTKVEIKNLNSFRAVEAAIQFEADQQTALHRAGRQGEIVQETKLWDPDKKVTKSMRGKEGAADYRYFPDPDLPVLVIPSAMVDRCREGLPEMPAVRRERYLGMGIKAGTVDDLIDERATADYFDAVVAAGCQPAAASNWVREEALRLAADKKLPLAKAAPVARFAALVKLVDDGEVARVVAKGECDALFGAASAESVRDYFASRGMIQVQDTEQLAAWVAEVLAANEKVVEDLKGGNNKAIGRLIGQVMKASGGQADPKAVTGEIRQQVGL